MPGYICKCHLCCRHRNIGSRRWVQQGLQRDLRHSLQRQSHDICNIGVSLAYNSLGSEAFLPYPLQYGFSQVSTEVFYLPNTMAQPLSILGCRSWLCCYISSHLPPSREQGCVQTSRDLLGVGYC